MVLKITLCRKCVLNVFHLKSCFSLKVLEIEVYPLKIVEFGKISKICFGNNDAARYTKCSLHELALRIMVNNSC